VRHWGEQARKVRRRVSLQVHAEFSDEKMLQALTLSKRRGECERRVYLLGTINLDNVRL
jgi:hypothetical protein